MSRPPGLDRQSATIRVKGLAIGIEFEDSGAGHAEALGKRCRKKGLLLSSEGGGTLLLPPALNIDRKTARNGLAILESCL